MTINSWTGASPLRGWRGLALPAGLIILSGCSVLDPDGDWRGRPLSHPVTATVPSIAASTALRGGSVVPPRPALAIAGPAATSAPGQAASVEAAPVHATPPASLDSLLGRLEQAYSSGRFEEASDHAAEVLKWWPREPRAWLREGNLRHRQGDLQLALQAYRRVLELTEQRLGPDTPERAGLRARAHANLAIVGVEQARQAIDALDASRDDPVTASHRARIETALRAVVSPGLHVPAASTPAPHPSTDMHTVATARSHGLELIRGGLVR